MTVNEARELINKANSRIFRLNRSQFKGDTPATRALDDKLERLGLHRTKKGYISTKGLTSAQIQRAGTQARYFLSTQTSTARGTLRDIAKRTNAMITKTGLDADALQRLYTIFDSKAYKRLKELVGSENVVAVASRKLKEKPTIDIREWLYREELKIRKNEQSLEKFINVEDADEAEITGELF